MPPRSLHATALALLGAALLAAQPAQAADKLPGIDSPYRGLSSSGERRAIELQAWWTPNYGHIHVTAAVPFGGTLTGGVGIPLRVILYNNPSEFTSLELVANLPGTVDTHLAKLGVSEHCPYSGEGERTCAFEYEWTFDSSRYRARDGSWKPIPDGWGQLQMWAVTNTPDDQTYRTSSRVPVQFANGNARGADRFNPEGEAQELGCNTRSFLARGWYDFEGMRDGGTYASATGLCIPMRSVRGKVRFWFGGGNGSDGLNRTEVYLSKTHAIPAVGEMWRPQVERTGRKLFARDGQFEHPFPIDVDTRTLRNGWHTIAHRVRFSKTAESNCSYCNGEDNHLWGVAVSWFRVAN